MAETDSFQPNGDYQNRNSEGLIFAFDLENEKANHLEFPSFSSVEFSNSISGSIQFIGKRRMSLWKKSLLGLSSILFLSVASYFVIQQSEAKVAARLAPVYSEPTVNIIPKEEAPVVAEIIIVDEQVAATLMEPQESVIAEAKPGTNEVFPSKAELAQRKLNVSPKTEKQDLVVTPKPTPPKKSKLNDAQADALMSGRYVFLKFGAEWCTPCQIMESTTFKHEKIASLLDQNFLSVSLDVDRKEGKRLKDVYYVEQLPTFIILDDLGNEVVRREGAAGSAKMIEMLESVSPYIQLKDDVLTVVK